MVSEMTLYGVDLDFTFANSVVYISQKNCREYGVWIVPIS